MQINMWAYFYLKGNIFVKNINTLCYIYNKEMHYKQDVFVKTKNKMNALKQDKERNMDMKMLTTQGWILVLTGWLFIRTRLVSLLFDNHIFFKGSVKMR